MPESARVVSTSHEGGARRRVGEIVAVGFLVAASPSPAATILFDEAHHNVHSFEGRYRDLSALLEDSGFALSVGATHISAAALAPYDVLIVPAPRGAGRDAEMSERARSAFGSPEVEAVVQWVQGGGGLLLVTDHAPIGAAAATLAEAFGVEGSNGFVEDPSRGPPEAAELIFTRNEGSLGDHPIIEGRSAAEKIGRVATFLGQSLNSPPTATRLLVLGPTSVDRHRRFRDGIWQAPSPIDPIDSAAGRNQGLALELGDGRVVILGEAGMLTTRGLALGAADSSGKAIDNRQFALNIVRWLAGQLE